MAVHQGLFGVYLGSIFAPNHKGMAMPTERTEFPRKQVLTSRNVAGGPRTDGLLQVAVVREFCAEIGVEYHETGLLRSWSETPAHLRLVRPATAPR